jgi:hypothetical protein
MDENRDHEEGKWLRVLCGLFLLLALYALSIGPITKLAFAGYLPRRAVGILYQPLNVVNGTPLETARLRYLQLWFPPTYKGDILDGSRP